MAMAQNYGTNDPQVGHHLFGVSIILSHTQINEWDLRHFGNISCQHLPSPHNTSPPCLTNKMQWLVEAMIDHRQGQGYCVHLAALSAHRIENLHRFLNLHSKQGLRQTLGMFWSLSFAPAACLILPQIKMWTWWHVGNIHGIDAGIMPHCRW